MSFLFDTNVLSELRKGPRADRHVLKWFGTVEEDEIHLSVLIVGELRHGVENIRRRDTRQAVVLERWLARLVRDHEARILPVTREVADLWGRLTASRPASVVDTLLAATALVHELTFVTRKLDDVSWTGVSCVNPFESA